MDILRQIVDSLDGDAPVRDVTVGSRCSAVWSVQVGVAFHFRSPCHGGAEPADRRVPDDLDRGSARRLAESAWSDDPLRASLGVAAINSLIVPDPALTRDGDAFDLVAQKGQGRRVVVVGHFPFVDRLRPLVGRLDVLELRPRAGDLPADDAPRVVPQADVVAITGATLVNHTLDHLLGLARGKEVILLGPSTVFSPVLFDHGVSAVCGSLITDPPAVIRCLTDGGRLQRCPGVRKVIWSANQR